jgi:hypothetical protein
MKDDHEDSRIPINPATRIKIGGFCVHQDSIGKYSVA